jgi:hypothetical protein
LLLKRRKLQKPFSPSYLINDFGAGLPVSKGQDWT